MSVPLPRLLKRRVQRLLALDDTRAIKRPYTNVGRAVALITFCAAVPLFFSYRQDMDTQQNILASCDWYAVSVMLEHEPTTAPAGHQWIDYEGGTNVWKKRKVLLNERGDKVATFLYSPKSSTINKDAGLIEVANEWLYHGIGAVGVQHLIYKVCPFRVTGISRLDLCLDFVPSAEQYEIISGLSSGKYYVSGKRNRTQFCSVSSADWMPMQYRGVEIPHCQSWGHKTSDVKWKLYYKSKELRDAVGGGWFGKPYIVDRWREVDFDENNVWRLEVSIKHCNKLMWNGNVVDESCLLADDVFVLRDLYAQRFIIRKNEGHKDKSNDSQVEFLPLTGFRNRIRCRQYDDVADDERHIGRISLLRRLVNAMDAEEIRYDAVSRDAVIAHVRSIVKRDGLQRYFAAMVGKTLEEWIFEVTEEHAGEYDTNSNHMIFKGLQPNTAWDA